MHILILLVAASAIPAYLLVKTLTDPLRSVRGPLAARFTRLWYVNRIRLGAFERDNIALHRQYGKVVRIAPNHYSIDDPDAVRVVYGIGGGGNKFAKSDWYYGWQHPDPERWTLFPDRNIKRHAEARRRFQSLYSMTSLVSYEPFVDSCGDLLVQRMREVATACGGKDANVVNMAHWFQCYAFDVIACITYGRRFGFLDRGDDINDIIAALDRVFVYGTLIGIFPRLHPLIFDFAAKFKWSGAQGRLKIMNFVQAQINLRERDRKLGKDDRKALGLVQESMPEDFLDKMLDQHTADPEKVTAYHVFMMGLGNIIAGSDTTAVSLSATLYYLLKYPDTMAKLKAEIREFTAEGKLSERASFKESLQMPYFQAAMKEALRMHAATGLPMWRVVPEGGTHICGQYFPAGAVVGVNTWTAHYSKKVFGNDAEQFRPERWLEAEEAAKAGDKETLRQMEGYYMPFGLGSRTCLGRHISILEMSKILPRLLREFDFELEGPEKHWECQNWWFVKPKSFRIRVKLADAAV